MTSYRPGIATVAPPTLEKQLEVLAAAHALAAQYELLRGRCEEVATLRRAAGELALRFEELQRGYGALVDLVQEQRRRRDPRLRSHIIRDGSDPPSVVKASADDPEHPGWPAGAPDRRGGKFRPKDSDEGTPGGEFAGDVIRVCVLMPDMSSAGTCMYWCHGGFLLGKQRNLGLGCPSLVREPG
jgi:hypothetical protein